MMNQDSIQFPKELMREVRTLRIAVEGVGTFSSIEQREELINRLKEQVCDIAITILMRADREKQNKFLLDSPE
jgi:hypothetical protein